MSELNKPQSNQNQTQAPQSFEGVIELSNNNFKVLNKALDILYRVAENDNEAEYYFNFDVNDVVAVSLTDVYMWSNGEGKFVNTGAKKVRIILRNGVIVEANEYDNSVSVKSIHECYCGD